MRFLVRTSLLALFLTYAANWWFFTPKKGNTREVRVDCSLYSAGQGLGPDGKPFQVTLIPIAIERYERYPIIALECFAEFRGFLPLLPV